MGLLKGSVTYSKFYAEGELPGDFRDKFMDAIHTRRFQPLTVEGEDEQRVGWVCLARPLEPDVTFDYNDVFFNSYINLAVRIDAWRFPGSVFKAAFAEAEKKYLTKKGREKLSKREKEDLKAVVGRKLRHQFSPTIKLIDLSWNTESNVVRYWSQSTKGHETLFELWEKTFPVKLVPAGAFTTAERGELPEARLKALLEVEPAAFNAA